MISGPVPADNSVTPFALNVSELVASEGQRVRASRYGAKTSEPSFERESGKTHSLEGGPHRTLSRSQRL